MKWTLSQSIAATIAYSELFSYPLTLQEIQRWLITDKTIPREKLKVPAIFVSDSEGYIGSANLSSLSSRRKTRMLASKQKWDKVHKLIPLLSWVPTIQLIGISGGLSMNNASSSDDIDLFFIVSAHTLWITRLFVLALLSVTGKLRRVGDTNQKDLWCTNMFVTLPHVTIPKNEQDIFSAHEVLQLVPIFERGNIYRQFLQQNSWVSRYLANAWFEKQHSKTVATPDHDMSVARVLLYIPLRVSFFIFACIEYPAKLFQRVYMRRHITTEIISDSVLRFHPKDMRKYIFQRYPQLLKKYKVPLDSRFLSSVQ